MSIAEYGSFDGVGLASLVHTKQVSPEELLDEALRRIEAVNPQLNGVVRVLASFARDQLRQVDRDAPLAGVPFLLKDLIQTISGLETCGGSRLLKDQVFDVDGELFSRFTRAGLVTVGRTNTPEFGILPVTEPVLYGPARNPWDTTRTPGGSSGGSAAMVAARVVPIASGGDGGGSIRIPASACGLFGLKPTRARTPTGPFASEHWNGFAVEHVLTRSVRDSAVVLDATEGTELGAPYAARAPERPYIEELGRDPGTLRIGFHVEPAMLCDGVHADCVAAVHDAAKLCEELGHSVEEIRPGHDPRALSRAFVLVVGANTAAEVREVEEATGRKASAQNLETTTLLSALLGRATSAEQYALPLRVLQREAMRLAQRFSEFDLILTPTLGKPPLTVGALKPPATEDFAQRLVAKLQFSAPLKFNAVLDQAVERTFDFVPFTPVANFAGWPSMSVPLMWNDAGLPIGSMFTANLGDEATLFRLAAQLENARPWAKRVPPVNAN